MRRWNWNANSAVECEFLDADRLAKNDIVANLGVQDIHSKTSWSRTMSNENKSQAPVDTNKALDYYYNLPVRKTSFLFLARKLLSKTFRSVSIPVRKVSFSTGQVVAIVSIAVIGGFIYVHLRVADMNSELAALSVQIDERLPPKQASTTPPSADTHSSTPPTSKDAPTEH